MQYRFVVNFGTLSKRVSIKTEREREHSEWKKALNEFELSKDFYRPRILRITIVLSLTWTLCDGRLRDFFLLKNNNISKVTKPHRSICWAQRKKQKKKECVTSITYAVHF